MTTRRLQLQVPSAVSQTHPDFTTDRQIFRPFASYNGPKPALRVRKTRRPRPFTVPLSEFNLTDDGWKKRVLERCFLCKSFKQLNETSDRCKICGHTQEEHEARNTKTGAGVPRAHVPACTSCPPYGELHFGGGHKRAKFARVSSEARMEDIWALITREWKLDVPSLVISVVGGSRNFRLIKRLDEAFRRGLLSAVNQSGAWLISTGLHCGVMKQVGKIVADCSLTSQDKVTAIGIAPWSCVHGKEILYNIKRQGTVSYQVSEVEYQTETTSLDPNHTHFLLVDDGTEMQYGSEIDFRVKLENYISNYVTVCGGDDRDATKVAVAMLMVAGGRTTLTTVNKAIELEIPVIVMQGSGRSADILATAKGLLEHSPSVYLNGKQRERCSKTFPRGKLQQDAILRMIRNCFQDESESENIMKLVTDCVEKYNSRMISVFDVDPHQKFGQDLGRAILRAFLAATRLNVKKQLELAIAWNRVDVAQDEILENLDLRDMHGYNTITRQEKLPKPKDFYDLLDLAIKADNAEFVQLLLDKNVSLEEFLEEGRLEKLYECSQALWSPEFVKEEKTETGASEEKPHRPTPDIKEQFLKRLQHLKKNVKLKEREKKYEFRSIQGPSFGTRSLSPDGTAKEEAAHTLFVWALLSKKFELAKVFWKAGSENIGTALMAVAIIKALEKEAKQDDSNLELNALQNYTSEFEDLALGVLGDCHANNEQKTRQLLVREMPRWEGNSCMHLAMKTSSKRFIAQPACQNLIEHKWTASLNWRRNPLSLVKLVTCMFLFFLIPKVMSFRQDNLTAWEKIWSFYSAPVAIFCFNLISYLIFLALYSYLLVVKLTEEWHFLEVILAIWVFAATVEEIRPLTPWSSGNVRGQLRNVLDGITLAGFLVGGILRIVSVYTCANCMDAARVILSATVIPCVLRLFGFYTMNKKLGPKLIMIRRMMGDLKWFMLFIFGFAFAYAVASQSILYPHSELSWTLLYYFPRKAYWQIYGELFLEEIEGEITCTENMTLVSDSLPRCPTLTGTRYVPVLSGLYVLVMNILLINLLIAMFSYTVQQVHEKTDIHWRFQRFKLTYEFSERSPLPPPLNLITYVFWCVTRKKHQTPFKEESQKDDDEIVQWENVITNLYVSSLNEQSTEDNVDVIRQEMKEVHSKIDYLAEYRDQPKQPGARFHDAARAFVKEIRSSQPTQLEQYGQQPAAASQVPSVLVTTTGDQDRQPDLSACLQAMSRRLMAIEEQLLKLNTSKSNVPETGASLRTTDRSFSLGTDLSGKEDTYSSNA